MVLIVYLFFTDVLNIEEKRAGEEAEKVKSVLSDETINSLAKYVHKTLGLHDLNCNYNVNNEKCRCCIKRKTNK